MPYALESLNTTVKLHVGGYASAERHIFGTTTGSQGAVQSGDLMTSLIFANINMDVGMIASGNSSIEFVDTCFGGEFCRLDLSQKCIRSRDCAFTIEKDPNTFFNSNSTIKMFVGWSGTDDTVSPFQSGSLDPVKLQAFSFSFNFASLLQPPKT